MLSAIRYWASDVWHLRWYWKRGGKKRLIQQLKTQTYQLKGVQQFYTNGETRILWNSQDALVLKALALYLYDSLESVISKRVFHLKGKNGEKLGTKAALRQVHQALPQHKFVFRTDAKDFYASIQHQLLFDICKKYIPNKPILKLIQQYLKHPIYFKGVYTTPQKGISLSCPLSPIMATLFLKPLDQIFEQSKCFYIRYMDDWIILAPNKSQFRKAIRKVNQCLNQLQLQKHPDKTFIGKISRGFDFLGYHFMPPQKKDAKTPKVFLRPSNKNCHQTINRILQLYEQDTNRIVVYIKRYLAWLFGGLNHLVYFNFHFIRVLVDFPKENRGPQTPPSRA